MNNLTKDFLELVKQNPDLPIIPIVDSEVCCGEDYGWWCCNWGGSKVNEYLLFLSRENNNCFYTRDEQNELEEYIAYELCDFEEYANLSDKTFNKMVHEKVEALNWEKAIIVYINLPKEVEK